MGPLSLKLETVTYGTNLVYRDWAITISSLAINIKPVSLMKLHRDLDIVQNSLPYLLHCIRTNVIPFTNTQVLCRFVRQHTARGGNRVHG